jgi:N-acetylmuramoyl-L-alanine amidase
VDACPGFIALVIGHTPRRPGATSARGIPEYAFNKNLVRSIASALREARFQVGILNESGKDISLAERSRLIERIDHGLLLSIHHDSVQPRYLEDWEFGGRRRKFSNRFHGYSLFVSAQNRAFDESRTLGVALGGALRAAGFAPTYHHAEPIPGEGRPILDREAGLFRYDGLAVLRNARIPAVLIEAGVLVNQAEERELERPETRERFAAAIVRAVQAYCAGR